jgi:hypothetical protein
MHILATLTNVALLVVLACLVAACTLGMLASLLALADVATCLLVALPSFGSFRNSRAKALNHQERRNLRE